MNRQRALELVREKVQNENLVSHMVAAEAIMGALAKRLGGDEERWRQAGLLHDLDVEETTENMELHGVLTVQWLRQAATTMRRCCRPSWHTTLRTDRASNPHGSRAVRLRLPDRVGDRGGPDSTRKRLAPVELKSLKKRFKEPSFAKGARREDIMTCSELGIELEEFLAIGLEAMKEVADDLGL